MKNAYPRHNDHWISFTESQASCPRGCYVKSKTGGTWKFGPRTERIIVIKSFGIENSLVLILSNRDYDFTQQPYRFRFKRVDAARYQRAKKLVKL